MGKEYKEFQKKIYACLVDYKEKHITSDCSKNKGEENPWFLPEKYWDECRDGGQVCIPPPQIF